ncbi:MAG TPA: ATP-binding protein [Longimicrobiales bacterium]|nr:ATP-binding protein [Longimicrobiales bacterium]
MSRNALRAFLRAWWPMLTIIALALLSIQMLRRSHSDAHRLLQQTANSLENVQESRRRLINAYLIHSRQAAGDRTFDQASAQAQLRAAGHALQNWRQGRSAILAFAAAPQSDSTLIRLAQTYRAALSRFDYMLANESNSSVRLRQSFSSAEQAAAALEREINNSLRASVEERNRAYRLRLTGWSLLLLLSLLGAAFTHRALTQSETGRAQSEFRLSRLRELAPVGIVECDHSGSVLVANWMWSQLTGRPEEEWHGRPWWEALDRSDRDAAHRLWERTRTADVRNHTMEARLDARPDADPVWLLIRIGDNHQGNASARQVVTFTDITQQRRIEEQLHHAQRMEAIGRLAGGVAHDFNNLLTSIRGFASLLLEAAEGNDALRSDLIEIERAADRGRALTRQLLTFSRQDRIDPQLIDAREVVRDLKRMLDRLVQEGVEITTALPDAQAKVLADRGQLEQVITNLVINASDAMEGSGRIRIAVEYLRIEEPLQGAGGEIEAGEYVLLTVSDTGPGIPPNIQERIFEPFFTTKSHGKGTGLGLSTVWAIVRQGGGHIHLYSAAGQGTVFRIYLPAASGAVLGESHAEVSPEQPGVTPGTVLVVEDEDSVRRLTTRILELRGWTVISAADGAEALQIMIARSGEVDLIVTDLMMRGMGGRELVAELRNRGIHLPTLFVSGYAESELDLEGGDFLEKPFTPAALIRRVAEVVRQDRPSV